jgi:signal transduction histidine kinase
MMNDIEISAQKIKELLSNLETHESAFEGTLNVNPEVTDISEIVLSALKASSVRIESKNLNVVFKSSEEGITAFTDREILLQIINNLVSNAIVFTPPGKNIYAYVSLDGERVRCEIIDEGPGLSEIEATELLSNNSGKNSHVGREESIGIGLTVANSLARKLGGELKCESMLGKGSTFVLMLPIN